MIIKSILVVCTGNICRSPIGERLLQHYAHGVKVESAGIRAMAGYSADPQSQAVSLRHGISLEGHLGRQLTTSMLRQADLILAMESHQLNHISAMAAEVRGKSMLFGRWLSVKEIPDPYRKSEEAFEYVFGLLDGASKEWAKRLNR
ncbi:protein tyrosine phosphatase [Enterobacter sp. UNJFSC 003]|uniref:arsenate reductase/protein-tyrosine-phosphatase family protein n=1 Tax=Enterobacter sp. UNJFSC 003 TaxID=3122077 RepID=UPI002EACC2D5|nr:protein tyrosine phosphatase [Serratia liquefaciens]